MFLNSLPSGFLFSAQRQINGKGRGGNKWISPSGCLMFSLVLRFKPTQSAVFLQYVVSLAVVEAIRTYPGYEVKLSYDFFNVKANMCSSAVTVFRMFL